MLKLLTITLTLWALVLHNSCNNAPLIHSNDSESARAGEPIKGELAFLLQHNGNHPDSVGFFTNQIVSRRLHNLLKDDYEKFAINMQHCTMVQVDGPHILVSGSAENPKNFTRSAAISINAQKDAIAVAYFSDSMSVYREQQDAPQHALFEEYVGLGAATIE